MLFIFSFFLAKIITTFSQQQFRSCERNVVGEDFEATFKFLIFNYAFETANCDAIREIKRLAKASRLRITRITKWKGMAEDGRDDDGEKKELDARWCGKSNTEPKGIVFDESKKEEEETLLDGMWPACID